MLEQFPNLLPLAKIRLEITVLDKYQTEIIINKIQIRKERLH